MKTKQAIKDKIISFAKTYGPFVSKDVLQVVKAKPDRIYTELWALKKKGVLKKEELSGVYTLNNNDKTVKVKAPKTKLSTTGSSEVKRLEKELREVTHLYNVTEESYKTSQDMLDNWRVRHSKMEEKYIDALAVIRYLENKLITAIQHDARGKS